MDLRTGTNYESVFFCFYIVMEIHHEIWNNDILRPELPLSLFNSNLCRVYNNMVVQNGTGRKFTKAKTYTKRCFIRHDIWGKKDMKEVSSSSVSICCVRPSTVPVGRQPSPNKGIHPAYQGYSSETPPYKGCILSGRQYHSSETPGQGISTI